MYSLPRKHLTVKQKLIVYSTSDFFIFPKDISNSFHHRNPLYIFNINTHNYKIKMLIIVYFSFLQRQKNKDVTAPIANQTERFLQKNNGFREVGADYNMQTLHM